MPDDDSDDDDLFGGSSDSDDTADLLANSSRLKKKAAPKKAPTNKKIKKKKKDDSDDSDGGLFGDSDDDDEKPAAKKTAAAKPMSKKERMEALAKRKRQLNGEDGGDEPTPKKSGETKPGDDKGYESEDSVDSTNIQRTKEDDDFIDTTGEDAEAVQELYAEQHFDDEPRDDMEVKKKNKKRRYGPGGGGEDRDRATGDPDNPIMAAVHRMKKKKREKRTLTEMEDEIKLFMAKMEQAADDDEAAIAKRTPALAKLGMLTEACDMLTKKDMQRVLLDLDVLVVCKRWIQPLKNGKLGNVTVRQRLLEAIAKMTGETGIQPNDLKRSEFGKVVMLLYKHPSETPTIKSMLKRLIEQWSRPIFQKSGNMRDLERVHQTRGAQGLAALSRQAQYEEAQERRLAQQQKGAAAARGDFQNMLMGKKKSTAGGPGESTGPRVRVPFSKGFSYSVRPMNKAADNAAEPADKRRAGPGAAGAAASGGGGGNTGDNRSKLSRRMLEKGRTVGKNQRSANVSVEGRRTKG